MIQHPVITENGAAMYATSGKALLDMNFKVSSYRRCTEEEIIQDFEKVYAENPFLALKWVFYVGDIRCGLGERRLFRILIKHIIPTHKNLVPFVAEYNRFDSLFELFGTDAEKEMVEYIHKQLDKDSISMAKGEPCSLLAKWMPSIHTSSKKNSNLAKKFCKSLGLSERAYRQKLSALRHHINIVERKMCDGEWQDIDYSTVPSKANLTYREAFAKHDFHRRHLFLQKLTNGEGKINASTAFPHEICYRYGSFDLLSTDIDPTFEAMWKALPNTLQGKPMIVVRDGSSSMLTRVTKDSAAAIDVATALAIYCSERTSTPFKDKFITFSKTPRFVDMSQTTSLHEKLNLAYNETECSNTNVEAVFDLLLDVAHQNNVKQEDIPTILVISDMEFDSCAQSNEGSCNSALFATISKKWQEAGYIMPHLAFWNLCSRTHGIPLQENESGVSLISGFSPNAMNMVLNGKLNPYEAMANILNSERYIKI